MPTAYQIHSLALDINQLAKLHAELAISRLLPLELGASSEQEVFAAYEKLYETLYQVFIEEDKDEH